MPETTDELLDKVREQSIVEIKMTERGLEFLNEDGEIKFILGYAGTEVNKEE